MTRQPITVPRKQYGNFQHLIKQTMKEFRDRLTVMVRFLHSVCHTCVLNRIFCQGFDEYTFDNHSSLAYAEAAAIIMLTTSVALAAASFYIQEAATMARITAAILVVLSAMSKYVASETSFRAIPLCIIDGSLLAFVPVVKEAKLAKEHLYQDVALFFWAWKEVQGLISQVEQELDAKALNFLSKFKNQFVISGGLFDDISAYTNELAVFQ